MDLLAKEFQMYKMILSQKLGPTPVFCFPKSSNSFPNHPTVTRWHSSQVSSRYKKDNWHLEAFFLVLNEIKECIFLKGRVAIERKIVASILKFHRRENL